MLKAPDTFFRRGGEKKKKERDFIVIPTTWGRGKRAVTRVRTFSVIEEWCRRRGGPRKDRRISYLIRWRGGKKRIVHSSSDGEGGGRSVLECETLDEAVGLGLYNADETVIVDPSLAEEKKGKGKKKKRKKKH